MKSGFPTSIKDIENINVRNKLLNLKKEDHILGFLLQGSRVTGFGAPDTDWDIIIYCTDEYYKTLNYDSLTEFTFEGEGSDKRVVGDYAYFSDMIFEQQKNSPMDIDHIPYTLSVVLWDKTGKLGKWVETLSRFPDEDFEDKSRMQLVQLLVAFGYARVNNQRNQLLDMKINLNRAFTISLVLWFTLNKFWAPQFKWWSKHVKRLNIDDEIFQLYNSCITELSFENMEEISRGQRN
ncbi:MAG: hypothetical protein HeimC2_27430 [Candidatus Heimdallarchaeota archaeon LC_2]|nr:MAG: hypothetical protein HeimC2_27430 [Candidatus Heimdallarchaeota archaeon LC_2]